MGRWLNTWRDSALTWPDLSVTLRLLPWQWRLIPRGWWDYSPRGEDHAGWWGVDGEWLMVKVAFGFNLPPFTWEHPPLAHNYEGGEDS